MKKCYLTLSALALTTLIAGCRPGLYVGSDSGKVPLSTRKQPVAIPSDSDKGLIDIDGQDISSEQPITEGDINRDPFDEANGAMRWKDNIVYFGYNSQVIPESEYPKVNLLVDYMKKEANTLVLIEGHCDSRGSDEYNRSLGNKRANSILEYLTTAGISPNRITVISKGEEEPAIPDAKTEEQHAKNRRGEFVIGTNNQ